jgi:hypothetical protein
MGIFERADCRCCTRGLETRLPRVCPSVGHAFRGNGWDGMDAHWRSKHEHVMPYERFWSSLCTQHRLG